MCLLVDFYMHPDAKPLIAEKNIPCYKLVELEKPSITINKSAYRIIAPCMRNDIFVHCASVYYSATEFQTKPIDGEITKAIHSLRTNPFEGDRLMPLAQLNRRLMCAYIPKGTKYWIGKDNDYASECIYFM